MTNGELFDQAKTALNVESDYALAKALELDQSEITAYRAGRPLRDAYTLTRLALALGRDPMALQAEVLRESEKCERKKAFWRSFSGLRGLGTLPAWLLAAAIALCALGFGQGSNTALAGGFRRRWRCA
ncbi:MAG: hypothetical protein PHU46_09330 [Rhodocyclaceae bacterium]|nr:hypothetical protein [Rhodocyclaceae bacterium]